VSKFTRWAFLVDISNRIHCSETQQARTLPPGFSARLHPRQLTPVWRAAPGETRTVSIESRTSLYRHGKFLPGKCFLKTETRPRFLARSAYSARRRLGSPASPSPKPREAKDFGRRRETGFAQDCVVGVPAAPGASRCCCASFTPSSRRPRAAACRRGFRRLHPIADSLQPPLHRDAKASAGWSFAGLPAAAVAKKAMMAPSSADAARKYKPASKLLVLSLIQPTTKGPT
jgi:hypothetical protein